MASLKFIMHVDDEQTEPPSSRSNKRDKEPPDPSDAGEDGQESSSSTRQQHVPGASHHSQRNLSPAAPASASASGKRRAAANRASRSPAAASSSSTRPPNTRRRSTTSTDSMDQTGYASSSSMGGSGSGMGHSNQPIRPMPPNTSGPELPVKLTPITGRVSRAKKGLAVHTCEQCKPPKTFTRAEHLRRHQLSHQTPQYQCTYRGCDRAFHRPDLLARHQQKHEQDGEVVSGSGGQGRRGSSQPSLVDDTRLGFQPSGPPSVGQSSGLGASTPVSDVPATPLPNPSPRPHHSPGGSSTQHSMSPNIGGQTNYNTYPTSSRTSIIYPSNHLDPSITSTSNLPNPDYSVPRTPGHYPLFVVTEGLSTTAQPIDSNPPDLTHMEASPWASSTDSSYSNTPAVDHVRNQRYNTWAQPPSSPQNDWPQPNTLLFPGPAATVQDHHNLHALATPQYFYTSPITNHPHSHHSQFPLYDLPMGGLSSDGHAYQGGQTHLQNPPISSVGSPSPVTTSTITAETLVTPSPALPAHHLSQLANLGRRKEMVMDVGAGVYGGGVSFGGGNDSPVLAAAQGLVGMGGCGGPGILTGTVRKAIPSYLDIYWARFHVNYPIVHRASFEAASEEVLRCAMAAVATQFLDGAEDRRRGNQLHEYAWQEAKRCLQKSLQTMQAILICEFFARFRGRKVVIKPSRTFDALFSRVSSPDFFTLSDSGSFVLSRRSRALSFGSSNSNSPDSSSPLSPLRWSETFSCTTPTTATSTLQAFHHNLDFNNLSLLSSSLFSHPHSYLPNTPAQQFLSASQVLDCDSSVDAVAAAATIDPTQASMEQRWRLWVDMEARRRLLAACFFLDIHTSIYYEQPRARHFNIAPGHGSPIPLVGNTTALWDAATADDWGFTLDSADPSTFQASAFPDCSRLGSADLDSKTPFDRALILAAEAARLPKRSVALRSEASSPVPEPTDKSAPNLSISRIFQSDPVANTYLALHYTPLQALLAVSGDTWLFSHKVLSHDAFLEHRKCLKAWAETHAHQPRAATAMSAPYATIYAARALDGFLVEGRGDISDYWGMYVCALICWAYGHRAARNGEASRATENEDVLAWLKTVGTQQLNEGVKVRNRKGAFGVVGLVRRRLEAECIGGRSRLFVDAVGVLKKLEENQMTWF